MATLVRWEPFRELASLQSEMSRMHERPRRSGRPGAARRTWAPALDVWETDAELVYAFDLPGVPEDAIQIEVADDTLTADGRAHARGGEGRATASTASSAATARSAARSGCRRASTSRRSRPSTRTACVEIHVPKPEEQKPRRIPLGSAPADLEASSQLAHARVSTRGPTPG